MIPEQLLNLEIYKLTFFIVGALGGMLFAYCRRWAWEEPDIDLHKYLVGDKHAVGRALTTLIILCGVTDGLDYLESMSTFHIILAGAGIGLMVPAAVDSKKQSQNKEITNAK